MKSIRLDVEIDAPVWKVWEVLTTPRLISQWAQAFMPGLIAESAWKTGGLVVWKDADGVETMRGKVLKAERGKLLSILYDHDLNPLMSAKSAFGEVYRLEASDEGSRLVIETGPFGDQDFPVMAQAWPRAGVNVKVLAETGMAARKSSDAA
jgi:uncharacterized protein YndB with AHSA1/START domain